MKALFMNLTLAKKLVTVLLLAGLIPLLIASVLASIISSQQLEKQAFAQLSAVGEIKGAAIKRYFDSVASQAVTLAYDPAVLSAAKEFSQSYLTVASDEQFSDSEKAQHTQKLLAFYTEQFAGKYKRENPNIPLDTTTLIERMSPAALTLQYLYIADNSNPLGKKDALNSYPGFSPYHRVHAQYHSRFRDFISEFGYYDFFLVDANSGNIVYSVFKEIDFATSLKNGPYANTNIATSYHDALSLQQGQTSLQDFESYRPSYDAPASFISTPIYDNGQISAVLILQIPLEPINDIMANRAGMGETGESYLVGSNLLMRSDSYNNPEQFSVVASFRQAGQRKVDTPAANRALKGETGTAIITNYLDRKVLSAYAPLPLNGFSWAIIAEIDKAEAFSGITGLKWLMFLIVILGGAGIAVFATYISKLISSPILQLSQAIKTVEHEGSFNLRLNNNTADEIGTTSRAFNALLAKLKNAISSTNAVLNDLAKGQYDNRITEHYNGQLAVLTDGVNAAVDQIKTAHNAQQKQQQIAEDNARQAEDAAQKASMQARETLIIKQALDVSATGVMIADANFNIIYTNHSLDRLMLDAASDIQQELSHFDPSTLMGTNIDTFHKNPAHQRKMLRELRGNYATQLDIGALSFNLSATPIRTAEGEFLGAVVEWDNITERLNKEKSDRLVAEENARIRQALDSSATGTMIADTNHKIIYSNHALSGLIDNASKTVTGLKHTTELPEFLTHCLGSQQTSKAQQEAMLSKLATTHQTEFTVGRHTFAITLNPVTSNAGVRIGTVIEWLDRTAEIAVEHEIDEIVNAAAAGDFSKTLNTSNKEGFFRKVSEGLNLLVTTTNEAVGELADLFSALAKGDLTKTIDREFEGDFAKLKKDANATVEKLKDVIEGISEAAGNIARGSKEISEGNMDLSQRTEEQAASLEETASSMEQMISVVQQSERNAITANELATSSIETARQGDLSVRKTSEAMSQIAQSSDKIANIIGVIDEIAFQTNLLALNAAVEAARAGEQGRGFAVVAGEVRNLAQRSASAAREIKDLIRDSVSKVNDGSTLVETSGKTLQSIVKEIERVGDAMSQISDSAREQTEGISRVNQAISHMDEMTQQNAALVEQASATSASLADLAHQLDQMVAFFKK